MSELVEKILNEIKTMSRMSGNEITKTYNDVKHLPMVEFQNYQIFFGEEDYIEFHLCLNKEYVGWLVLEEENMFGKTGVKIEYVEVKKDFRNKGIGNILYKLALARYDFLTSDVWVSKSAQMLWNKLSKEFTVLATDSESVFKIPSKQSVDWQYFTAKNISIFKKYFK